MSKILSFDVGIKNLAYAEYCTKDDKLLRWDVISINYDKSDIDGSYASLACILDELFDDEYSTVLIENQPSMKNPVMKTIQCGIHMFFASCRHYRSSVGSIVLVSASCKMKMCTGNGKTYSERKRLSIDSCRQYVSTDFTDWGVFFNTSKKKDDLSDSLLQLLWYVKYKLK